MTVELRTLFGAPSGFRRNSIWRPSRAILAEGARLWFPWNVSDSGRCKPRKWMRFSKRM